MLFVPYFNNINIGFVLNNSYYIEYVPSMPSLWVFSMKGLLNLIKDLSASIEICHVVLSLVLLCDELHLLICICWINLTCQGWHWRSWWISFLMCCYSVLPVFCEFFTSMFIRDIGLKFSFCCVSCRVLVSGWCWPIKWWEDSLFSMLGEEWYPKASLFALTLVFGNESVWSWTFWLVVH